MATPRIPVEQHPSIAQDPVDEIERRGLEHDDLHGNAEMALQRSFAVSAASASFVVSRMPTSRSLPAWLWRRATLPKSQAEAMLSGAVRRNSRAESSSL